MGNMGKKSRRKSRVTPVPAFLTVVLAGMLMVACSGDKSPEQLVKERSEAKWQALIQGDLKAAYPLYSEAFRDTTPFKHFEHRIRGVGLWSKVSVKSVECRSEEQCLALVDVAVVTKMRGLDEPLESSTIIEETWVKEGVLGRWYFVK